MDVAIKGVAFMSVAIEGVAFMGVASEGVVFIFTPRKHSNSNFQIRMVHGDLE